MAVKLFVLGLPGSGKSTVARYITTYTKGMAWKATRINDYVILQNMFMADTEHKQFKPTEYGGFDVLDLTAFDIALQRLEQEINKHISSSPMPEELILIEFSRNEYQRAFLQFSPAFLQDAYFLYLDVDIETCKGRIRERVAHPSTEDDFFVSEYIFRAYYNKDNGQSISSILERSFGIDKQRVAVIENNRSLQVSTSKIEQFVETIFELEAHCLRQTDPIQIIPSFVSDNELAK
jgi:adenylate kinase family enzyme